MKIEVQEQFPGRVVEVMKPDAVRWVGTAVVVEVGGGLDELARHYEFTAEEALVLGLAISQVAVKGLDQRAVCQVYERAMGRVMWANMADFDAGEVPENLVMFPGVKSVRESTPPAPPQAGGKDALPALPQALEGKYHDKYLDDLAAVDPTYAAALAPSMGIAWLPETPAEITAGTAVPHSLDGPLS